MNEIQTRAYFIWESVGRPAGRDMEHWLQAERELSVSKRKQAYRARAAKAVLTKKKQRARK